MLWVLVGLSMVELVVVHALLMVWHPWIATGSSLLSLAGTVWLVLAIRSFDRLPVVVDAGGIDMRAGRLKGVRIAAAEIAGLREDWTAGTIRSRSVLNLALVAWPNVVVDLKTPRPGRRRISAIAHRLDDPAGFASAVDALRRAHD